MVYVYEKGLSAFFYHGKKIFVHYVNLQSNYTHMGSVKEGSAYVCHMIMDYYKIISFCRANIPLFTITPSPFIVKSHSVCICVILHSPTNTYYKANLQMQEIRYCYLANHYIN